MKTFFKAIAWILGIPIFIAGIFVLFGWMAVRFNFWPPNCSVLPIIQARRVCEFSKLDKAPKGKPAEITFWVTVPHNTPQNDSIFIAIDGREQKKLERINLTSFQTKISAITGDVLKYRYLRNSEASVSDNKEYAVKSLKKTIYDYISNWSDLKMPRISKNLIPNVEMYDTWSINYNMQFIEDTRNNLDESMKRVKEMGGKEIGLYSFIVMAGDKENFTVKEMDPMPTTIFGQIKHPFGRDATITEKEMKKIAETAKKYGLATTIYYNIWADPRKYITITANPFASRGTGANTAEERAGNDFGRYDPKTKEWLDRYFSQLQNVLVEWTRRAQSAGIDAIDINPHYRPPSTAPLDIYADAKWREIISSMREIYKGKIYSDADSRLKNDVDGLFYNAGITIRQGATITKMRDAWKKELRSISTKIAGYNKPIFVMVGIPSFEGALNGKPGMEFLDYVEVEAAGYKRDWQAQADGYEAFFEALSELSEKEIARFAGFGTRFYSWDDMMGPDYIPSRYSDLASNIRNKPAEAVWKKWILR